MNEDPAENDIVSEVFGEQGLPRHLERRPRQVMPWHKARKQWIRRYQWGNGISALCNELKFDGRPFRYLSLPGEDLLDIRILSQYLAGHNCSFKYLGLNDEYSSQAENTPMHLACAEVNALGNIHHESQVIKDRFECIANSSSLANQYVRNYGPFDAVNLDLCSSISPKKSMPNNYYEALHAVIEQQIVNRPANEPWLLFLTTRAGAECVEKGDLVKLCDCIKLNVNAHEAFAHQLLEIGIDSSPWSEGFDFGGITQQEFVRIFSLGIGKWLLQLLSDGEPKWSVTLESAFGYRVNLDAPDMISFAFVMRGHVLPPGDPSGLSSQAKGGSTYNELYYASNLVHRVISIDDLDMRLENEPDLYWAMEEETVSLLKSARYEEEDIRKALQASREKLSGKLAKISG